MAMVRYWLDEDDEAPAAEVGWLIGGSLYEGEDWREKLTRARRFHEVDLADATSRGHEAEIWAVMAGIAVIDQALAAGPDKRMYGRATRRRKKRPWKKR